VLFITSIDSTGTVIDNTELNYPILEAKGYVNKSNSHYILRTTKFNINQSQGFDMIADVFKSSLNQYCYNYTNSLHLKLNLIDGKLITTKNTIGTQLLIEKYQITNDKFDMNGKICIDSLYDFEKIFNKSMQSEMVVGFKTDEVGNPIWLMKKVEANKGSLNVSVLSPVKKVYQLTNLFSLKSEENPSIIKLNEQKFLIGRQVEANKFLLQINNW
jgi:hypothetical protein